MTWEHLEQSKESHARIQIRCNSENSWHDLVLYLGGLCRLRFGSGSGLRLDVCFLL